MADQISIKFDEKELERILDNALTDVERATEEASLKCSKESVSTLKATSPGHGDYAAGWAFQKSEEAKLGYVVWNPKHYQLTHLLEFGHIIAGTGKRSRAFPHIDPVNREASRKFLEEVEGMKL